MHERIMSDPVVPTHWGKNQKGMQAGDDLTPEQQRLAIDHWLQARNDAVYWAKRLDDLGLHKQIANRLVEPFMWITVIISTTSFEHFRKLRDHEAAEPHFQDLARAMVQARDESEPNVLSVGEWHMPLTFPEDSDFKIEDLVKLSAARCARVSYMTHDGKRDPEEDFKLHDRLVGPGHWSPFEHVARAEGDTEMRGNFKGFTQYRKLFESEFVDDPAN